MKIQICRNGAFTEVELEEGPVRVGGALLDDHRIEALPPGLITLSRDAGWLVMEARKTLAINGVLCPPKVRRLLMADEHVMLADDILLRPVMAESSPPPTSGGTLALLRGLLGRGAEPRPPHAATLLCLTGLDLGRTYPLADGENELGRGHQATIRIRDRAVSRRHARLTPGPDGYTIEDLGSPNGVFINGQRLEGPCTLAGGEVLELGYSLLRFNAPPARGPHAQSATASVGGAG